MTEALDVDVVIFGGGAAGLWLLDEVVRADRSALLLEAHELGSGQTIASQGIIHGGLKYTLGGLFTSSARAIREMPLIWRRCLAGEAAPDLSNTRLRAEYCHLWRTNTLTSRLAMIGARAGLRIEPVKLADDERPPLLSDCPGTVARLDEQVIEPASFLADLSRQHQQRILKIDAEHGLEFEVKGPGEVQLIRLINPQSGEPLDLRPGNVILAAGAGNARLREMVKLSPATMQRRPLHMVMLRGGDDLPALNAHCVDGSATRLTITSTRDLSQRTIWQIGGQIAEAGARMEPRELIALAKSELRSALPGLDASAMEWSTYRVDRAEAVTRGGARPEQPFAGSEGNAIAAWPTKLALAPELARRVVQLLKPAEPAAAAGAGSRSELELNDWPRPIVALPPWETQQQWFTGV